MKGHEYNIICVYKLNVFPWIRVVYPRHQISWGKQLQPPSTKHQHQQQHQQQQQKKLNRISPKGKFTLFFSFNFAHKNTRSRAYAYSYWISKPILFIGHIKRLFLMCRCRLLIKLPTLYFRGYVNHSWIQLMMSSSSWSVKEQSQQLSIIVSFVSGIRIKSNYIGPKQIETIDCYFTTWWSIQRGCSLSFPHWFLQPHPPFVCLCL